jgi:multidrug efflux system outer membrane protein
MRSFRTQFQSSFVLVALIVSGCAPNLVQVKKAEDVRREVPNEFLTLKDEESPDQLVPDDSEEPQQSGEGALLKLPTVSAKVRWWDLFDDSKLNILIEQALNNNQELKIITQDIQIAQNEIMARRGEYLPRLGLQGEAGSEKVGFYTSQGANDATAEYEPGKFVPEHLPNYSLGLAFSWELDIWKKLRNASKAALHEYLASVEGRNFMLTELISEVATTYYELLALDKKLQIIDENIEIQKEALQLIQLQKQAARVTSLAVKRFEAEVLKNQSHRYEIKQLIVQKENRLNFLVGRYPEKIDRDPSLFGRLSVDGYDSGVPSELLRNRPDVRRAENELEAAKLNVKVARARFYPSLSLEAGAGYESFNSKHLFETPESSFYNLAGNLTAPLLNRAAIKADYLSANSKQIQAIYDYEKTLINAYTEAVNQMARVYNLKRTYGLKQKQVKVLAESVEISGILFKAARADYVEVLMTRRDALEAQIELIEIKMELLSSVVELYQALGGGWRNTSG